MKALASWIILASQAAGLMLVFYLIADSVLSNRQFPRDDYASHRPNHSAAP